MRQGNVYDRAYNYKGTYGEAGKADIHDLSSDRFKQQMWPLDKSRLDRIEDGATSYITHESLRSREARDYAIDLANPRQELSKDPAGLITMNVIPNLTPMQLDLSKPEDYEAHNSVSLFMKSRINSAREEKLFDDPAAVQKTADDIKYTGVEAQGKPTETRSGNDFIMRGSAAGMLNDKLRVDEDGSSTLEIETSF